MQGAWLWGGAGGSWGTSTTLPVFLPPQNGQRGRMDRGNSLPSMLEQKVRTAGGWGLPEGLNPLGCWGKTGAGRP